MSDTSVALFLADLGSSDRVRSLATSTTSASGRPRMILFMAAATAGRAALVSAYRKESRPANAGGSSIPPLSGPITTGAPSLRSGEGVTGDTLIGW